MDKYPSATKGLAVLGSTLVRALAALALAAFGVASAGPAAAQTADACFDDLAQSTQGLALPEKIESSLLRRIDKAEAKLDRDQPLAAVNGMATFQKSVRKLEGKVLSTEQTQELLGGAGTCMGVLVDLPEAIDADTEPVRSFKMTALT